MFKETLKMSFKTLTSNAMRTFLTVLGVVIGIGSIIGLTSITEGTTAVMMEELSVMGGDTVYVAITSDSAKTTFNETDIAKFLEIDGVTGVQPSVTGYYTFISEQSTEQFVSVTGVNNLFFERNDLITDGRAVNYYDSLYKSNVVVLGDELAFDLFGNSSPVGETVKINGITFSVIGVASELSGLTFSSGNVAYIPYAHMESTFLSGGITTLEIYYDIDAMTSDEAVEEIEQTLYYMLNNNEDAYTTFSMQAILDMMETMTSMMGYLMTGIAAISLLVGGIGIMNMMLTSVTERTNEIGLKKALGAEKSVILLQFIVEAVIISVIGGIIGIICGYTIGIICGALLGFDAIVTFGAVALAVTFSAAVGLVFGIMPAKKAANLSPIDALRAL